MALRVKIGSAVDDGVSDSDLASVPNIMVRLDIRRTLDDNLIISDHPDIDIVIVPNSGKVVAMAKKLNSGVVYGAQDRLFTFLKDRGVVDPGSIQGGSIYASMEGAIPSAADLPTIKIMNIQQSLGKCPRQRAKALFSLAYLAAHTGYRCIIIMDTRG